MRCVEEIQSLKMELVISQNNTKTEKLVNTTLEDKFREIKKDYNTSLKLNASLKEQIDDGLKIFKELEKKLKLDWREHLNQKTKSAEKNNKQRELLLKTK